MNWKKFINNTPLKNGTQFFRSGTFFLLLACSTFLVMTSTALAAEPTNPLLREFSIKVDPSALNPSNLVACSRDHPAHLDYGPHQYGGVQND